MDFQEIYPPALIESNNRFYLVPGWKEIPDPENYDRYYQDWKSRQKPFKPKKIFVRSQTSNKVYEITKIDNGYRCSCPGYRFHGYCKHIKEVER